MDREFTQAGIASSLEMGLGDGILTAQKPTLRLHQLEGGPLGFELEFQVSPADWREIEATKAFHLDSGERSVSFGQGFDLEQPVRVVARLHDALVPQMKAQEDIFEAGGLILLAGPHEVYRRSQDWLLVHATQEVAPGVRGGFEVTR
ncbi:MAG: hypothetical protein ACI9VR_004995 [Cognaticolwellia sp.]|jgi:hypothetical protein